MAQLETNKWIFRITTEKSLKIFSTLNRVVMYCMIRIGMGINNVLLIN